MAIAIPARTLVGECSYIYLGDPSLDHDVDGFADKYRLYRETGDEKHLPLKPGDEPTRFKLRLLSRAEFRYVQDQIAARRGYLGALRLAASMALVGLGGLRDEDGKELKGDRFPNADGFQVLPHDVLEKLDRVEGLLDSIGATVMERSSLTPK